MAATTAAMPVARPCAVARTRQQTTQAAASCQRHKGAAASSRPARRHVLPVAAAAAAVEAAAPVPANGASASSSSNGGDARASTPSAAETARTIVDLVAHGTLCTIGDDGVPLGTYVSYVLDEAGQPILRLRACAVHTANLKRDPKCSLFVQPGEHPARLLARVTLIGSVEAVDEELAEEAAALHNTMHSGGAGVDAPQTTDLYFRLAIDRCFYVGQLSGDSCAEVLAGDAYRAADTDPLRTCAAELTRYMNAERPEDILRVSCHALGATFESMAYAEMLWVDRLGIYLRAARQDGTPAMDLRVPFVRAVEEEREARSALTMMAQVAWEAQRPYTPQAVPKPPPQEHEDN